MTPPPLPVLLDTDPGVDDALALLFALRSGRFDVKAITVVAGNCPVNQGVENAFRVLEVLEADFKRRGIPWTPPPVYRGAEGPLGIDNDDALHVHGRDGLGNVCRMLAGGAFKYPTPSINLARGHAVDAILEAVRRQPDEITLVTLGPLTNVALAFRNDPEMMSRLRGIVSMAGAFREHGNVTPVAEYNVWADPEAGAELLLAVGGGAGPPLTFVGLDVTHRHILTREILNEWVEHDDSPLARFLLDVTASTIEFHRATRGFEGMYLHDPMAVLCALRPEPVRFETLHVQVECDGTHTRGMTVADLREWDGPKVGVPVKVCASMDEEGSLDLLRSGWLGEIG